MGCLKISPSKLRSSVFCVVSLFACIQPLRSVWAAPPATFADETYVVKDARLWTEPNKFAEPIALLKAGVKLNVLSYSTNGEWIKVSTPAGREGWVVVKWTTFEGRREKPLIKGTPLGVVETEVSEESVATQAAAAKAPAKKLEVEGASPNYSAPSGGIAGGNGEFEFGVGYINQLSRGNASGGLFEAKYYFSPSALVSLYLGFGYEYVRETSSYVLAISFVDKNVETVRTSSEFFPTLGLRFRSGPMSLGVGGGWLRDLTNIETRNQDTGEIYNVENGVSYTGSDSANMIFLGLSPAYAWQLNAHTSLALGIEYQVFFDLSDGAGTFAGDPTSRALHNLGAKLSYLRAF